VKFLAVTYGSKRWILFVAYSAQAKKRHAMKLVDAN